MRLDHIMYAVTNLPASIELLGQQLGIRPIPGGAHPGAGTHNALLSLGASQYLEVIAPDPGQVLSGNLGADIRARARAEVRTWAVQCSGFEAIQATAHHQQLGTRVIPMSRTTPQGVTLRWQILFVTGHGHGNLFPFFIDWLDSPHPATTTPVAGKLSTFTVFTTETRRLASHLQAFGIEEIRVDAGPPRLEADITGAESVRLVL